MLAYDRVLENASGGLESPGIFCNQESGNPGLRRHDLGNYKFTRPIERSSSDKVLCYVSCLPRNADPQVRNAAVLLGLDIDIRIAVVDLHKSFHGRTRFGSQ